MPVPNEVAIIWLFVFSDLPTTSVDEIGQRADRHIAYGYEAMPGCLYDWTENMAVGPKWGVFR